ncbi:hypothetical protein QR680_005334 [Steinernema hermaphroditum]|uniref:Uncharacterized protein n=1 Tax=Steinernema hermaphroditum TaxID=289476 RepID=A0AA39LV67_9BILA|nr:hypothetical protein QR680_005334 [Steinernema hermaphroditum]
MSVDKTIEELSGTLAQLGQLVGHINSQLLGITSRINITLDNFDSSIAGIAVDARAMTGKVGTTVQQVPHAWVFYLLFITLIVVFILLSILLVINLFTKAHAIYTLVKGSPSNSALSSVEVTPLPSARTELNPKPPPRYNPPRNGQVALSMENEPRRPGNFQYGGLGYHESLKQAYHQQSDESLTRRSPLNMETTSGPFITNRGHAV